MHAYLQRVPWRHQTCVCARVMFVLERKTFRFCLIWTQNVTSLNTCFGRWIESICGQYLSHIYGKRQARDISRTLEIFKTVAASETNINYTVLMMLRSKTLTEAMPKVMFCSMIDPIHIHEVPRY